jgi:hypothetical protein
MKIKVYSIVVFERITTVDMKINATNPMVSTNKILIDKKVGELMADLGANYELELYYKWRKCNAEDEQSYSYNIYNEYGDGYTILVEIHEIEV